MRKRSTRKYRHWSPRFKWTAKDEGHLIAFEREVKGISRKMKRRRDPNREGR
jgi:hypothetical protein